MLSPLSTLSGSGSNIGLSKNGYIQSPLDRYAKSSTTGIFVIHIVKKTRVPIDALKIQGDYRYPNSIRVTQMPQCKYRYPDIDIVSPWDKTITKCISL